MNRLPALAAVATAALVAASLGTPAWAEKSAAPAKTKKVTAAKPASKPATARRVAKAASDSRRHQAKGAANGLALAAETVEALSTNQLAIAARVLTGRADCEFDQTIDVSPLEGRPGHFSVQFKKARYTMVPEETSTGAVRLLDRKAGVMWLQIPVKSMLLNSKIGQRMVDACTLNVQRATAATARPVANSLTQ